MEEKIRGLKALMRGGTIHSVKNDPRFGNALEDVLARVRSTSDPKQKLLALTVPMRVASRIKSRKVKLKEELGDILHVAPPALSELGDADDRFYAAQALKFASGDWVIPYLARSIVEEEAGEKARSELVQIFLETTTDLSCAFNALRKPITEFRPETELPGDSAAKRLKRILSAVRKVLLLTEQQTGDDIGRAIHRLVEDAFRRAGPPNSRNVAADITSEIAGFLHDLVRTHFSLAAESSTYRALYVPSRWFLKGRWPVDAQHSLSTLSRDIEEAIALLARQDIADDELLKSLALVEGSRSDALNITSRIASRTNGLSREIVQWLRRGRVPTKTREAELMAESSLLAADRAIALLLLDSRRLTQALEGAGQDILNEVRIFEPGLEDDMKRILARARGVAIGVNALVGKRSLKMRGEPGEVVDYSQVEHEGIDGPITGTRRVRIVNPLVERVLGDNVPQIVLKAVVEKLDSSDLDADGDQNGH